MNIDPGAAVGPFSHDARNQRKPLQVKFMRHALDRDRFERGISQNDFFIALRRRIALIGSVNVCPKRLTHLRQLRHETCQKLLGFCFGRFMRRDFAEASANLGFEARVQTSHSSSRRLS